MNPLLLSTILLATPATELRAAATDIQTVAPQLRPSTRYLTLYAIAPDDRPAALQVTSYVLNALSRGRSITLPEPVTPTLIRFNITQYAPEPDDVTAWLGAWEKLATTDPYFHLQTEVLTASTAHRPLPTAHSVVTTDGPWLDLALAASLRVATASTGALLRADYFITAATQPPAYYQFAGIPETETDFLKSLGVDLEVIQRLRADVGANLITSGVTGKPRRIVWSQGPLGGVYSTLDVQQVEATRDPLRRPITVQLPVASGQLSDRKAITPSRSDGHQLPTARSPRPTFAFKYDVSEWFALAPNGLWRTALYDVAGRRQDSVPDRVAKDTSDPHADGIIVPLISCIRCHRESGLRPFSDDQQLLLGATAGLPSSALPPVSLYSPDPNIARRAAEFYDEPRLQRQIAFDRQTYSAALARATSLHQAATAAGAKVPASLTSVETADALAALVRNYAYFSVTREQAATEVGITVDHLQKALAQTHDPIILLLLQDRPVLRDQWTSSFPEAAQATVKR